MDCYHLIFRIFTAAEYNLLPKKSTQASTIKCFNVPPQTRSKKNHHQLDFDLQALFSLGAPTAGVHFITDEANEKELEWIASVLSGDEVSMRCFVRCLVFPDESKSLFFLIAAMMTFKRQKFSLWAFNADKTKLLLNLMMSVVFKCVDVQRRLGQLVLH